MASTHKLYNVTILVTLITLASSSNNTTSASSNDTNLAQRLKVDGEAESATCWESLFQLQACTGEVIMFFLNGEAYLGPSCCHAIRVVGHDCWPEMLGSLGFTHEEGDVLQDYCDAEEERQHMTPPPS